MDQGDVSETQVAAMNQEEGKKETEHVQMIAFVFGCTLTRPSIYEPPDYNPQGL